MAGVGGEGEGVADQVSVLTAGPAGQALATPTLVGYFIQATILKLTGSERSRYASVTDGQAKEAEGGASE